MQDRRNLPREVRSGFDWVGKVISPILGLLISTWFTSACGSQASQQGQVSMDGGGSPDATTTMDSGADANVGDASGGDAAAVVLGSGVGAGPCGPAHLATTGYSGGVAPSLPPFVFASEFGGCTGPTDCGCGLACVDDPLLVSTYFDDEVNPDLSDGASQGWCEQLCTTTADCADPVTVCRNGSCTLNVCGAALDGGPASGGLGQSCEADGNPGTCQIVYQNDNYGILMGVCMQSGTATGPCTPGASRGQADEICVQSALCLGNSFQACGFDGGPTPLHAMPDPYCEQVCNGTQTGACPSSTSCVPWQPENPMGVCAPSDLTFGVCR